MQVGVVQRCLKIVYRAYAMYVSTQKEKSRKCGKRKKISLGSEEMVHVSVYIYRTSKECATVHIYKQLRVIGAGFFFAN